ncbi:MAG: cytochrome b/b6 domain-containing protein [Rhodobiaceae bacterium]|nr:cytochrome b/b6 domain-containing protein [Rhodobiaceae bacterium]
MRRHRLSTRLWHWGNVVVLFVMLMSGLMIFNAHPRLYWGKYGANFDHAWLEIGAGRNEAGSRAGFLRIGDMTIETTGILGMSRDRNGQLSAIAFPGWATIPSTYDLALSRRWHLTFAWFFALGILIYLLVSLANRHLWRDIVPTAREMRPASLWETIRHHAMLRLPKGEAARNYNVLQKISYLVVLAFLIPLMVLTGLTMSPAMDASWPWLLDLFGGRQSARSIHFIVAALLVSFIVVHLLMVLLAGPVNEIRSMITGRYRLPKEKGQ